MLLTESVIVMAAQYRETEKALEYQAQTHRSDVVIPIQPMGVEEATFRLLTGKGIPCC